jgi:hypothetical protein
MTAGPLQLKSSREVRDMQIGRQMSTTPKRAREARYSVNPSCNVIFEWPSSKCTNNSRHTDSDF